ncbi:hypothetical protein QBC47DRAFT_46825 [Echria macrotheca]|uniref:Uncharacterized protein n=1 Tax=Echria macrotheca TaxID=438768 RepID=A0AAJ0FA06_9PEZI|nr:hypothetical protein QBC47DRAFT_46825 [Echria macrotheca]
MGAYCSVYNDTSDTMYIKYGANTGALQWASIAGSIAATIASLGAATPLIAASTGAAAGFTLGLTSAGLAIAKSEFDKELRKEGYSAIQPGGTYTSEKLTLSLLMQANIVLVGDRGSRRGTMECWTGPGHNDCNRYNASQAEYEFRPF